MRGRAGQTRHRLRHAPLQLSQKLTQIRGRSADGLHIEAAVRRHFEIGSRAERLPRRAAVQFHVELTAHNSHPFCRTGAEVILARCDDTYRAAQTVAFKTDALYAVIEIRVVLQHVFSRDEQKSWARSISEAVRI